MTVFLEYSGYYCFLEKKDACTQYCESFISIKKLTFKIIYNIRSQSYFNFKFLIKRRRNFHSFSDQSVIAEITDYLQRHYEKSSSVILEISLRDDFSARSRYPVYRKSITESTEQRGSLKIILIVVWLRSA